MIKDTLPINYSKTFLLCIICKEEKGRSRKFYSIHALKWHFTHEHETQSIDSMIDFSKTRRLS